MKTLVRAAILAVAACVESTKGYLPPPTTPTVDPTTPPNEACAGSDHCVIVADDGAIDPPYLQMSEGETVTFVLGNRWQSVAEITSDYGAACDGPELEVPWDPSVLVGPMPRLAGGITVRGEPDGTFRFPSWVWESDAVSGVLLVIPWRDVEPAPDVYDFAVFTDALAEATKHGKLVSVGIQAGGKSPDWLFEPPVSVPFTQMVVAAASNKQCFDQPYAHFWLTEYTTRLTALQTALAGALQAHAGAWRHVDKVKISGVNLLTAETRMPVDRNEPCGTSGETTSDAPVLWAAAGYRPETMYAYFEALWADQLVWFPDKDINLMEINRAFPNVDDTGAVVGFADPEHVRELIRRSLAVVPDRFVVLNAALDAENPPQDTCLMAWDEGAAQIGFQTKNGIATWVDLQPVLDNAEDATTPKGATPVSFVEIYLETAQATSDSGNLEDLKAYDERFRARAGHAPGGETFAVSTLPAGMHHYKIAGHAMTSTTCHVGTIEVLP